MVLAGTSLRMELDRVPLWRGDHVSVAQLREDFARYLYLPRLKNPSLLVQAINDGLSCRSWERDSFTYADSYDDVAGRYRGLRAGGNVSIPETDPLGLLVKPDVAKRQLEAEQPVAGAPPPASTAGDGWAATDPASQQPSPKPRRFHGSAVLDAIRAGRDAGRIAEEIIAHLAALPGAEVRVTLEIEATVPGGAPENVVRTVTENSRTLKLTSHGFERE
jgi:hypothetical protein